MEEIDQLRNQLLKIFVQSVLDPLADVETSLRLTPPTSIQISAIKQVVAAAFIDQIAVRHDVLNPPSSTLPPKKLNIWQVPFVPLFSVTEVDATNQVYIHPSSSLASQSSPPEYVIYELLNASATSNRLRMIPLVTISKRLIEPLARGSNLLTYSKPLMHPMPPRVFTEDNILKREAWVIPRLVPDSGIGQGAKGWELPAIKHVEILD
jgi:ATP-dependent RNA helicase DHX37/DHR1